MRTLKNQNELSEYLTETFNSRSNTLEIRDVIFDFDITIPLPIQSIKLNGNGSRPISGYNKFIFINCNFNYSFKIRRFDKEIIFDGDCIFNKSLRIENYEGRLYFVNSKFYDAVNLKNSLLKQKIRFRECDFFGETYFDNTKFEELADFWRCTFHKTTIFYKSDFLGIVVFSGATFKKNVLFTYTLIEKLLILRGTKINEGLDLSTAILKGELSVFDLELKNYKSITTPLSENGYESAISSDGDIPIKNKRETYRILKKYFENQSNNIESIPFKKLEMETLHKEAEVNIQNKEKRWNAFLDLTVLFLNQTSNNFGSSYLRGILFVIITGWIFFYLSILQTDLYYFKCDINGGSIESGFKHFVQFLNPAHKVDYLGEAVKYYWLFFFFDYLGRTFVGYGIYQTVQAFRKFK